VKAAWPRGLRTAETLPVAPAAGANAVLEGFIERTFIFFPTKEYLFSPHDWGLRPEDVYFTTPDGVNLHAWFIECEGDSPVVLWFHGNAGNISDRVENAKFLSDRGLSLFMPDYRGYGKSEGAPSEKGIYIDGQASYDYLVKDAGLAPEDLIVFGRSLGTCVAVYVASRNKCAGIILESAFTNMADMARSNFPIVPGLGGFKDKFDSLGRISSVTAPILFIHGDEDDIVPYALGKRLFEGATAEKQFYTVRDAHHNDVYNLGGKAYFDKFEKFVREKTGKVK
jgi:fermentation-respiration switch protein FrsA (DUF1100 family)